MRASTRREARRPRAEPLPAGGLSWPAAASDATVMWRWIDAGVGATMIAIVLVGLASTGTLAQVQNRAYRDSMGRNVGRSVTDSSGRTTFYDNMGRNTGRAVTRGGTTTIYDNMGRQTGTIGGSK